MSERRAVENQQPPGVGVDARGGAVIDPTENVIALVKAGIQRIDDMAVLREALVAEKVKGMYAELVSQEKISVLRADHAKELRQMESDRVDKIRSVDVQNAAATAQQLLNAVNTLSTTAQTTAEVLRNQVATQAAAVASQTERALNPILERLALLEKSSYLGAGKAGISDPMLEQLFNRMQQSAEKSANTSGKNQGISLAWGILLGAVALVATLLAIFNGVRVTPAAPQIIYATPPAATK